MDTPIKSEKWEIYRNRGAGFIGSDILQELIRQDHEVVIIDDLFSGKMEDIQPFLSNKSVSFVQGNVTDISLLMKTCAGADGVFHESAISPVPQ